MLRVHEL
jgi:hypothetical protein